MAPVTFLECICMGGAGTTALKQSKYGEPAKKVQTVAVLGAGLMGAGRREMQHNDPIKQ